MGMKRTRLESMSEAHSILHKAIKDLAADQLTVEIVQAIRRDLMEARATLRAQISLEIEPLVAAAEPWPFGEHRLAGKLKRVTDQVDGADAFRNRIVKGGGE